MAVGNPFDDLIPRAAPVQNAQDEAMPKSLGMDGFGVPIPGTMVEGMGVPAVPVVPAPAAAVAQPGGIGDPQQYVEIAKGVIPGAIRSAGTAVSAPDVYAAGVQSGAAERVRERLAMLERAERGEAISPQEDFAGYAQMSPEQRARAREGLNRIIQQQWVASPTPVQERPFFKMGEAIQDYAKGVLPPAPGYDQAFGRQVGEGLGSVAFGLPVAALTGPVGGLAVFSSMGVGEATQRAVEFDRKERAAGRPGLTQDQITTAGLLGVGPGSTDLLPVEVLLGRLPVPIPQALRRPIAQAIGRVGIQAAIEGVQEGGQGFLQDLIAREVYNPNQPLGEQFRDEAAVGAAVGGLTEVLRQVGTGMVRSAAGRRGGSSAPATTPEASTQPQERREPTLEWPAPPAFETPPAATPEATAATSAPPAPRQRRRQPQAAPPATEANAFADLVPANQNTRIEDQPWVADLARSIAEPAKEPATERGFGAENVSQPTGSAVFQPDNKPAETVRLYRGEGAGAESDPLRPERAGRWWTVDPESARGYAGQGGSVYAIDVPLSEAARLNQSRENPNDFVVPPELRSDRRVIERLDALADAQDELRSDVRDLTPERSASRPVASPQITSVVTPDGSMEIPATPEIVELDNLKLAEGSLQPRDRSRAEYAQGARERASRLDPLQLQPSRVSDTGAPVVAPDGTILSGNGRTMSIAEVYNNPALVDRAEAYRASLGPAASGMRQPVMIMRTAPMGAQQATAFADLSNRGRIAQMSATERAMRDAQAMGADGVALYQGGEFTSPQNRQFLENFMQRAVTSAEMPSISRNGELTQEGAARMRGAVLAAAYGDADVLARMLESTDDNIRSITGGMLDAAPAMARLRAAIASGETSPDMDATASLVNAVKTISDLRSRRVPVQQWLAQSDAFGRDPLTESWVKSFYYDETNQPRRREKVALLLNDYATEAIQHRPGGLFADETTTADVLAVARRKNDDQTLFPAVGGVGQGVRQGRNADGRRQDDPSVQGSGEILAAIGAAPSRIEWEARQILNDARSLEVEMKRNGASPAEIADTFNRRYGAAVTPEQVETGNVWWKYLKGEQAFVDSIDPSNLGGELPEAVLEARIADIPTDGVAPGAIDLNARPSEPAQARGLADQRDTASPGPKLTPELRDMALAMAERGMAPKDIAGRLTKQFGQYVRPALVEQAVAQVRGEADASRRSQLAAERRLAFHQSPEQRQIRSERMRQTMARPEMQAWLKERGQQLAREMGRTVWTPAMVERLGQPDMRTRTASDIATILQSEFGDAASGLNENAVRQKRSDLGYAYEGDRFFASSPMSDAMKARLATPEFRKLTAEQAASAMKAEFGEAANRVTPTTIRNARAGNETLKSTRGAGTPKGFQWTAAADERLAELVVSLPNPAERARALNSEFGGSLSPKAVQRRWEKIRDTVLRQQGDEPMFAVGGWTPKDWVDWIKGNPDAGREDATSGSGDPAQSGTSPATGQPGTDQSGDRSSQGDASRRKSGVVGSFKVRDLVGRIVDAPPNSQGLTQKYVFLHPPKAYFPDVSSSKTTLRILDGVPNWTAKAHVLEIEPGVWQVQSYRIRKAKEDIGSDFLWALQEQMGGEVRAPEVMPANAYNMWRRWEMEGSRWDVSSVDGYTEHKGVFYSPDALRTMRDVVGEVAMTAPTVKERNDARREYNELSDLVEKLPPEDDGVLAAVGASSGLDMSPEARKARAEAMGFDTSTVYYHATRSTKPIDEFKIGMPGKNSTGLFGPEDVTRSAVFFTPNKELAEAFADQGPRGTMSAIVPVYLRIRKEANAANGFMFNQGATLTPEFFERNGLNWKYYNQLAPYEVWRAFDDAEGGKDLREALMREGYDAVRLFEDYPDVSGVTESIAVFDPANIRSVNAAFDPAQEASANLMAAVNGEIGAKRDAAMRARAAQSFANGKVVRIEPEVVAEALDRIEQFAGMFPPGTPVGTVESIAPYKNFPTAGMVRVTFKLADGSKAYSNQRWSSIAGVRNGLWPATTDDGRSIGVVGFFRFDFTGYTSQVFRGELGHENVHALRRGGHLGDLIIGRLARHSDDLRVMDMGLRSFMEATGHPNAGLAVDNESLAKIYNRLYAGQPDIKERITQEKAAHLIELYNAGAVDVDSEIAAILDSILDGSIWRGTQGGDVGATLDVRPMSKSALHDIAQSNFDTPYAIDDVKNVPISSLRGGAFTAAKVGPLAEKIRENGWLEPLVVEPDGNVIEGQHRLRAMQQLGAKTVPVHTIRERVPAKLVASIRDAAKSAGLVSEHARQLAEHMATIIDTEGVGALSDYDAPTGFEKAWDAAANAARQVEMELVGAAQGSQRPSNIELQREKAEAAGFDTGVQYWHGTGRDLTETGFDLRKAQDKEGRRRGVGLGKGKVYLDANREGGNSWAMAAKDRGLGDRPNVVGPLWVRGPLIDEKDYQAEFERISGGRPIFDSTLDMAERDRLIAATDKAVKAQGYKGIQTVYRNRDGSVAELGQTAMFNTSDIRHVNADFDQERSGSSDLMAAASKGPTRLAALHNLSVENLAFADRMGGIAVPSIGVVKEGMGMGHGFGEITMIGRKSLGDPEQNPVYDADAWSIRFPRPDYKAVSTGKAQPLMDALRPYGIKFDDTGPAQETWDAMVNRPDPERAISPMLRSAAAQAMFLDKVKGKIVEPVMRPATASMRNKWVTQPAFQAFLKQYGYDGNYSHGDPYYVAMSQAAKEATDQQIAEEASRVDDPTDRADLIERWTSSRDTNLFDADSGLLNYGRATWIGDDIRKIGKKEVDPPKTRERLERAIKPFESEFKTWVESQIVPLYGEPRIKVNGRFEPYTLENITRVMTAPRSVTAQEDHMTFGEGKARAAAASRIGSVEEARNRADWQMADEKSVNEAREKAKALMEEWRNAVVPYNKYVRANSGQSGSFGSTFEALDGSMRALATWAKRGGGASGLRSALAREDFVGVPADVLELGLEAGRAFMEAPVPYFESKPQRVVKLNEFAGAVIPKKASAETRAILDKNGIPYREYDSNKDDAKDKVAAKFTQELAKKGEDTLFAIQRQRLRDQDSLGYYSHALEVARDLKQSRGTPEQLLAQLKSAGVKQAEIEATNLPAFLDGKKSITRDEIVAHLEANRVGLMEVARAKPQPFSIEDEAVAAGYGSVEDMAEVLGTSVERVRANHDPLRGQYDETKWSAYSLDPSNPTYRETVLHLPDGRAGVEDTARADAARMAELDALDGNLTQEQRQEYARLRNGRSDQTNFRSGHFPEPNIIGHMMTSLVRHEGQPTYLIDQIQSDWGQRLRDVANASDINQRKAALLAQLDELNAPLEAFKRDMASRYKVNSPVDTFTLRETIKSVADADLGVIGNRLKSNIERKEQARFDLKQLGAMLDDGASERRRIAAEISNLEDRARDGDGRLPTHPLVNTTDQWTTTTLRRALRQAADADAAYIAIPHGDTVLSYNPGDTNGMRGFYGSRTSEGIVPKNLRKILEKLDKDAKPFKVDKLETPSGLRSFKPGSEERQIDQSQTGFTLFPLTPKIKQAIIDDGQPLFAFGGLTSPGADINAYTTAIIMAKRGASPKEIWDATNWFKRDGQWLYETDEPDEIKTVADARIHAERQRMTPDQRRATPPWETPVLQTARRASGGGVEVPKFDTGSIEQAMAIIRRAKMN